MKIKRLSLTFSTIFGAYLLSLLNFSLFSLLYSCNAIFYNKFILNLLLLFFTSTYLKIIEEKIFKNRIQIIKINDISVDSPIGTIYSPFK